MIRAISAPERALVKGHEAMRRNEGDLRRRITGKPARTVRFIRTLCALVFAGFYVPLTVLTAHGGFVDGAKTDVTPNSGTVVQVVDGDTVMLQDGTKVRYLGVDAPEMDHENGRHDCYAAEASKRNAALVLKRTVRLVYDIRKRDDHGRLLAYVTTPEGICVNEELIREGLAYVSLGPEGFSRFEEFVELQRQAVLGRRGMHGHCRIREEPYYVGNIQSFIFHRPHCSFGGSMRSLRRVQFSSRWDALMKGYRPCRRCKP